MSDGSEQVLWFHFCSSGAFFGAVIALTSVYMEHPSRETLL